ncbi:hypothetical protein MGG_16747 [Pyricularia oryzae 70-15]|uniref:Uncharacterized protein n=3 Tax=Pyricularia oryzae TaxID=318829 RepID=G4N4X4_PYRO7|nr:uncharacterized protein MGG_16747 [Pyricularia oryzae 70-15]EHA52086.1 hypothetical protein MGG_16747 [Pyricularia oryzae 70-15]ELQ39971.1 hypothetical protein OOU_Y34scaffold00464g53 [Pyricularia oryzae Y34]
MRDLNLPPWLSRSRKEYANFRSGFCGLLLEAKFLLHVASIVDIRGARSNQRDDSGLSHLQWRRYSGAPVKGDCTTYYKYYFNNQRNQGLKYMGLSAGRGFWEWSIGAENRKKDIQYTHICKVSLSLSFEPLEATSDNVRSSADNYPATSFSRREKEKGVLLVRVILVKQRPRQGTLGFIANRQRSGKGAEESGRLK